MDKRTDAKPGGKRAKRRGRILSPLVAPKVFYYVFAEDRKVKHVHQHLSKFSDALQVDGYVGYGN